MNESGPGLCGSSLSQVRCLIGAGEVGSTNNVTTSVKPYFTLLPSAEIPVRCSLPREVLPAGVM